jgi:hypothetical protein
MEGPGQGLRRFQHGPGRFEGRQFAVGVADGEAQSQFGLWGGLEVSPGHACSGRIHHLPQHGRVTATGHAGAGALQLVAHETCDQFGPLEGGLGAHARAGLLPLREAGQVALLVGDLPLSDFRLFRRQGPFRSWADRRPCSASASPAERARSRCCRATRACHAKATSPSTRAAATAAPARAAPRFRRRNFPIR